MDALKNKPLNLNLAAMFIVSLAFAYVSANLMVEAGAESAERAYSWGFIIGRALMGVVLPLALVAISLGLFRPSKPILLFSKAVYTSWWGLFVILSSIAILGSSVPPQ